MVCGLDAPHDSQSSIVSSQHQIVRAPTVSHPVISTLDVCPNSPTTRQNTSQDYRLGSEMGARTICTYPRPFNLYDSAREPNSRPPVTWAPKSTDLLHTACALTILLGEGYGCLDVSSWAPYCVLVQFGLRMLVSSEMERCRYEFLREWIGCDAGGILLGGNKGHDAQDDMQ